MITLLECRARKAQWTETHEVAHFVNEFLFAVKTHPNKAPQFGDCALYIEGERERERDEGGNSKRDVTSVIGGMH